MEKLKAYLSSRDYPGRGIVVGMLPDGKKSFYAYFIMGRSANSRNRIFSSDGERLFTEAFDASKVEDPSLIIYNCSVRAQTSGNVIITNGDHTDTIHEVTANKGSFVDAMEQRRYEPDMPNFTPRIAAEMYFGKKFAYRMGICKSDEKGGENPSDIRCFYSYSGSVGEAHIIHTYRGEEDGVLLPFSGEPVRLSLNCDCENVQKIADEIWASLDGDNKVSLAVAVYDELGKKIDGAVVNRNNI